MIQWRPLWEHGGKDLLAAYYAIRAADARTGGVEPVDIDPDRHMANVPLIPRNARAYHYWVSGIAREF